MSLPRTPSQVMALLARESRWRYGAVPDRLAGQQLVEGHRIFAPGEFALKTDSGYAFHYVQGQGVTIERTPEADQTEQDLWLNGSVYAAIACLNGLYPVHASAIALDGQVHAFTGPSGAGKSTLVAGLGQRGLPLFCDDTMLLELSNPTAIIALPGHKRLKLTDHALGLTGARPEGPVGSDTAKSYAAAPGGIVREPLPLARLVFLEQGSKAGYLPVTGGERLLRLDDDHYTQHCFLEARRPTREHLFALRATLARQIEMTRLIRPLSTEGFAESLDLAEELVRGSRHGEHR